MALSLPFLAQYEGRIHAQMKNIKTGQIQTLDFHNVAVNQLSVEMGMSGGGTIQYYPFYHLRCGSGSTSPSGGDTALAQPLWSNFTRSRIERRFADNLKAITTIATFVIPATPDYVGTVRELGFVSNSGRLMTRALLQDAEGNPYEFNKTDLDQLTIEYSITLSLNDSAEAFADASCVFVAGSVSGTDNRWDIITQNSGGWSDDVLVPAIKKYKKNVVGNYLYSQSPWYGLCLENSVRNGYGDLSTDFGDMARGHSYSYNDPRWNGQSNTYTSAKLRIPRDCSPLDRHFIHYMTLANGRMLPYYFQFPNTTVFPLTTLEGLSVGTGDGSTTEFAPPMPFWVMDSEKIYVDGVLQVPNVDYTADWFNNLINNDELFPSTHLFVIDGGQLGDGAKLPTSQIRLYMGDSRHTNAAPNLATYRSNKVQVNQPAAGSLLYLPSGSSLTLEMPIDTLNLDWNVNALYLYGGSIADVGHIYVTIEVSDDQESWTALCTQQEIAKYNDAYTTEHTFAQATKISLPTPILKRYWRITVTTQNAWYSGASSLNRLHMVFRRDGAPIRFTNPPAAGALITMDCQIDRPYKDSNHVIDTQFVVQY